MKNLFENWRRFTNESIEDIDPQYERHEGLISALYDIMMDNATGDQEADLEAAKIELIDDGKAAEEELSKIGLDHILQMKGPLAMGEGVKTCKKGDDDYEAGYAAAKNSTSVKPPAEKNECWKMGWNAAL